MIEPGTQRIPFQVDISRMIDVLAKQIYQDPLALLRENAQNAFDAIRQRLPWDDAFAPSIVVQITPSSIVIADNGIGMTPDDLRDHYWRAGSSSKNTPEARAAGVVGTFGIGAMANFGTIGTLYETDYAAFGSVTKDFVRNIVFPRVSHLVPSSTRQGAEAFLKSIRKTRDVFEYEYDDLDSLTSVWEGFAAGRLTMIEAANRSVEFGGPTSRSSRAQQPALSAMSSRTSSRTRLPLPGTHSN